MKLEDIIGLQMIGIAIAMFGCGGLVMLIYLGASINEPEYILFVIIASIGVFFILVRLNKLVKASNDKELMRIEY